MDLTSINRSGCIISSLMLDHSSLSPSTVASPSSSVTSFFFSSTSSSSSLSSSSLSSLSASSSAFSSSLLSTFSTLYKKRFKGLGGKISLFFPYPIKYFLRHFMVIHKLQIKIQSYQLEDNALEVDVRV